MSYMEAWTVNIYHYSTVVQCKTWYPRVNTNTKEQNFLC